MLVLPFSSSSSSTLKPHNNNTKFKQTKESYGEPQQHMTTTMSVVMRNA
jgi:hypothetical protein